MMRFILIYISLILSINCYADDAKTIEVKNIQPETIPASSLNNFSAQPTIVQKMLDFALNLAGKNLGYQYGSADPKNGAMDCSGTVYYILNSMGIKDVPRSSNLMYQWTWEKGHFHAVNSNKLNSFEFEHLKAGDLLFWSGTYKVDRDPNVTHVMIYLGKNTAGKPLMIGASNGRTFNGRKIYGVSVFDFNLPSAESKSRFLGYSCTPGINC